jgi:hypothetical protein
MTYYLKYLKYKNKYLELKNMVGGDFTSNEAELDRLWLDRSINKKVFHVTYPLFKNYSQYCWISGPRYGLGFFLYLSIQGSPQLPENKGIVQNIGKYTLWHISTRNIGLIERFNHTERLLYRTTIELKDKDGTKLPIGTDFDWSNDLNCYPYRTSDGQTFKAELILSFLGSIKELRDLWQARKTVGKVFSITYENLRQHYSEYCWISGPKYGLGFFLYLKNPGVEIKQNQYQNVYEYDLWFISKKNIGPIKPFNHAEKLLHTTTVELTAEDGTVLPIGTKFDWSHKHNGYLYLTTDGRTFKAELIL